jgi:hypothetical protein
MKSFGLGCYAIGVGVAVAMLSGCGGSQPATSGIVPQSVAAQGQAHTQTSSYNSILYANQVNFVTMLSYPELKAIGRFRYPNKKEFGNGCPDDRTGNIYFPLDGHYFSPGVGLTEYVVGGTKPIGSLKPSRGHFAVNCAVDPTTGNIAVVLGTQSPNKSGVGIYTPGSRRPVTYEYPSLRWYASCVYDNTGNLFIEGETNKSPFLLLELPKGSNKLMKLSLNPKAVTLDFPVQWDGKYITIEYLALSTGVLTIYRISVSGSKATVVGKTELRHASRAVWLQNGNTAIAGRCCSDSSASYIAFYDYPAGGNPTSIFKGLRNKHGGAKPSREVIGLTVATVPSP